MAAKKKTTPTTPAEAKAQLAEELASQPDPTEIGTPHIGLPERQSDTFVDDLAPMPVDLPTMDEIQADAVEQNAKLGERLVELEMQLADVIRGRETLVEMVNGLEAENKALKVRLAKAEHPSNVSGAIAGDSFESEPATVDGEKFADRAARLEGRAAQLEGFKYLVETEIGRLTMEARAARIEQRAAGE